ncbi:unnamed protein product [Chondrus crispus]|uniref:Uncharacterized protein n=1 Tax=Chondrus crispus TaxID=2769 RepID=R7Q8H2_CHOCR|nr:unnamed protein product [Chondrus crispus]CDF34837.1 unnamed protein product [Chondrus crispus]|eukprot:XP_005714656.1 unnamed protein product [Chondrus crispus]
MQTLGDSEKHKLCTHKFPCVCVSYFVPWHGNACEQKFV